MAVAIVQSSALVVRNGDANVGATLSGVVAGNAIVVTGAVYDPTANIHFTAKDGTTSLTTYDAFTPGGNYSSALIGWELNVAAGSHTITVAPSTASSACYLDIMVHEVSGLGTTQPSVTVSGTTTGATLALAGATPAQNGCIIFTVIADDANTSSSTATATTPSGYTSLWSELAGNTSQVGAAAYQVQTTAAPVAPSWTGLSSGGGTGWAAIAVAFAPTGPTTNTADATIGSPPAVVSTATATLSTAAVVGSANAVTGTATSVGLATANATVSSTPGAAGTTTSFPPVSAAGVVGFPATAKGATSNPGSGAASLIFHTGWANPNGTSQNPTSTPAITTPALIPLILVATAGQSDSTFASPELTDNYGNTYVSVDGPYNYAGITSPVQLFKCVNAAGGAGHVFSLNKNSPNVTDEATLMVTGWDSGGMGAFLYASSGTDTAGPLATTHPNSAVVSFWYPADFSGINPSVYTAPSGWTGLDFFENGLDTNSGADAYISVPVSGASVSTTWGHAQTLQPQQAQWLVEVLAGNSDATSGVVGFSPRVVGTVTLPGVDGAAGNVPSPSATTGTASATLSASSAAAFSPGVAATLDVVQITAVGAAGSVEGFYGTTASALLTHAQVPFTNGVAGTVAVSQIAISGVLSAPAGAAGSTTPILAVRGAAASIPGATGTLYSLDPNYYVLDPALDYVVPNPT